MDKDLQEYKKFLEQQLEWSKKQDCILEEIENKLHKMKKIAQSALNYEFTEIEIEQMNDQ